MKGLLVVEEVDWSHLVYFLEDASKTAAPRKPQVLYIILFWLPPNGYISSTDYEEHSIH